MLERLRIQPEDALTDFRDWHRFLRVHLAIFLVQFALFSIFYYWLEANMENPYFSYFHQMLSHFFVIVFCGQLWVMVVENWGLFKRVLAAFLFRITSPYNLAIMRATVMGILAGHLAFYIPSRLAQVAALPHSSREPLPGIGWLIDILPINPELYAFVGWVGVVLCLMAMLGLFTRFSLIASTLILFYMLGVPQFFGKMNHTHFMLWAPAFLAFSPAGDVFSLDAQIRRWRGNQPEVRPHYRYGIAMKLIFLQLALVYFFSGMGKLWQGGFEWFLSDNLVHLMRLEWLENYGNVPAIRLDNYPVLCRIGGTGIVLFELFMPFLILTPKTRVAAAVGAISFHNITDYFLNIDFIFLQNLQAFHLDLQGTLDRILRKPPWYVQLILALIALSVLLWFSIVLAIVLLVFFVWKMLQRRKGKPANQEGAGISQSISPWLWRVGLFILAANFCFGFTQTNSWPFSAYPSYSFVREGYVHYIWFQPILPSGAEGDLNAMGERAGFQKENILPMGERGAYLHKYGSKEEFQTHVLRFWLRFREKVPELKASLKAYVLFQTFSTNPDHLDKPIMENILGEIQLAEGEWTFIPLSP